MNDTTDRSRWTALFILCTGVLMIVLDVTIVNVALPTIQDDLGFSQSDLAWVVNAYLIAFGGLLMLAGRIGDLVSRRGVFIAGLALFTVSSLLCGLAQTQAWLVAARFTQGVGGAMASSVVLGMIVTMFPEPREQAKAIGIYGFVASAGGSIGLVGGGAITQTISWHWIFFINVPIGIATALAARRHVAADRGIGWSAGADVPGAVLITGALMLLVYTIVKPVAEDGWGSGSTLAFGGAAIVLLIAFVAREATARDALIPLRIFRSRNVVGANLIQVTSVAAMFGLSFLGALYFQGVLHYDPLQTGLAFLPITATMGTLSLGYAEKLAMRFGARRTLLPGLVLVAAGILLFARVPVDGHFVSDVLPSMLLIGSGFGIAMPGLMTLAMSAATPEDAGVASGLINTTTQVGGALGLAVLATLASNRTSSSHDVSHAQALVDGYHLAFFVSFVLLVVAVAVAVLVIAPERREAPAAEPALQG